MSVDMEQLIRKILADMQNPEKQVAAAPVADKGKITVADYPVSKKHPEWIRLSNGESLDYVTLDNVVNGKIQMKDLRISPEILRAQGEIAADGGRKQIRLNFNRAAEMTKVSDKRLLEMYNALRPYRSSKQELLAMADELEREYGAVACAAYVREAAENYERRKKLKGDN